jgi:RNA-splicing ligase RtcB
VQRAFVEAELRRTKRHRPPGCAGEGDRRRVGVIQRLEHDHLVAGVAQGEDRGRDRLGGAEGDEHVLGLQAVSGPLMLEHRLT